MVENQLNSKVVILGGSHHNTLGVVRSLGERDITSNVILVDNHIKDSFVLRSKYVEKGWIFQTYEKAIQFIIDTFHDDKGKSILIATSDAASSSIDQNFNRLMEEFYLPNGGKQGNITYLMNKSSMYDIACKVGLKIAETWFIGNNDEKTTNFRFPCIIKPISSLTGTKADIRICHNLFDLELFIKDIKDDERYMVQEYLSKEFEYQLIGCSIDGGKNIIIPGYTQIIRSTEITNTGFLKYLPISDLNYNHEGCIEFIKECHYSGLFSLEFIRGKDGNDYFLEINFRNDGNAYSVTASGVNLPYIWVNSSFGDVNWDEIPMKVKPLYVMPEFVDIFQMIKGKISLWRWLKDLSRTNSFLYFSKSDIKPFYYEFGRIVMMLISRIPAHIVKVVKR